MNQNKTYFQRVSTMLESFLKQYKDEYPQNYGILFRRFLPTIMITLPLLLFFVSLWKLSNVTVLLAFFIGPVLLVFGLILKKRYKSDKISTTSSILSKINSLKQQIAVFDSYPDVKQYSAQFDEQVHEVSNRKKQLLRNFTFIKIGYFVFGAIVSLYCMVSLLVDNDLKNEKSANDITDVLQLDAQKPFLTLAPLHKEIAANKTIASPLIEIYFRGTSANWLTIKNLNIANAAPEDVYRLMITDGAGRPVSQCPKFVFLGDKKEKIESDKICYDNLQPNNFESLQTMLYLQKHADNLFFTIEQLE